MIDLSDTKIKNLFYIFINDKKQSKHWTNANLAEELDWQDKTVNRYVSNNGEGMPGKIPEANYYELLEIVGSNHDEFNDYVESSIQLRSDVVVQDDATNDITDNTLLNFIDGLRIDVSSIDNDANFYTGDSKLVELDLALEVKANGSKNLLQFIARENIKEYKDIPIIIRQHVLRIFRDEIIKIQSKQFNLSFDRLVKPTLIEALQIQLGNRYGFSISVLHLIQMQTDYGLLVPPQTRSYLPQNKFQ